MLEHLRQACQVCASLISLFKNLVYKNIEAQIRKTSPSGQRCVPTVSLHVLTKYVTYMEIKMDRGSDRIVNEALKTRLLIIRFSMGSHRGLNQPRNAVVAQALRTDGRTDGQTLL